MIYCSHCGKQVQEHEAFCPSCGKAVGEGSQSKTEHRPPQTTARHADSQENKGMAVLAYILFFIPLLSGAHKTSPFVKYHTNQGTVLFLATLAFGVIYWILISIFTAIFFGVGAWGLWGVLTTILGLCWLLPAVLCVIGIVHAAGGKQKPLPVIGGITILS